jgi:tetratricopeptide (TPR) repeat protein
MANAYWGQQNLSEALNYAQQALTLNESFEKGNDLNISANLAILANIYYNSGNPVRALELGTRALGLMERCAPSDTMALASMINNVATIQVANGLLADARYSFDRALVICKKTLPEGHPKRVAMEINIQRITEMEQRNGENS